MSGSDRRERQIFPLSASSFAEASAFVQLRRDETAGQDGRRSGNFFCSHKGLFSDVRFFTRIKSLRSHGWPSRPTDRFSPKDERRSFKLF